VKNVAGPLGSATLRHMAHLFNPKRGETESDVIADGAQDGDWDGFVISVTDGDGSVPQVPVAKWGSAYPATGSRRLKSIVQKKNCDN
jgi:hypothetical protein